MVTSSQNEPEDFARVLGVRDFSCWSFAFGFLCCVSLNASVILDVSAFARFAAAFDTLGAAWATAACGYVGIVLIATQPGARRPRPRNVTETATWAVLSLACYTTHLFLLRWPWLSGTAEVGSRLTRWSELLSTTIAGIPWFAFVELLCIAVLLVHACVGALSATAWQRYGNLSRPGRLILLGFAVLTYIVASNVVVALATGRR